MEATESRREKAIGSSLEKNSSAIFPEESILNSYKFARPRVYVKNCYESEDSSVLGNLKYISENIGPKSRTPAYNQFIDYQLRAPKSKKGKKVKPKGVSINNIDFSSPTLKLAEFSIGKLPIKALVDTGSTHCLMSVSTFRQLNLSFQPLKIAMKVAGSVLHDNIVGTTSAVITFSAENSEVHVPTDFLIAHTINGYEAILGATILMDPDMVVAITPSHLCFTEEYSSISVPLINAGKDLQANHSQCQKNSDTLHSPMGESEPTLSLIHI